MGPSHDRSVKALLFWLNEMSISMSQKDESDDYLLALKEAELLINALPLSKLVSLGKRVDSLSFTVHPNEFDRWFFYVFDSGYNTRLEVRVALNGIVHVLNKDISVH